MKTYTVYFSEPVALTYVDQRWNPTIKKWEEFENVVEQDTFTFHSLAPAKKLIRENLSKYKGSSITKIYANGDWEPCGEIKLSGSNKTFMANTRQTKAGY